MSKFYKNVVGYGSGLKVKDGKQTDQNALIFFVEKKTSDIPKKEFIPKIIDGIPTDVIATGRIKPMLLPHCSLGVRDKTVAPLRGGMTIGSETLSGVGTLGAIVKSRATGKVVALTNAHVAGNPLNIHPEEWAQLGAEGYESICGSTAVGEKMYQGAKPEGNQFGEVVGDVPGSFHGPKKVDGSIISIKSEFGVTPGIMGLTKYAQTFQRITTTRYGDTVYKSGRTTGTTEGTLISIDATILVDVGCGYTKEYRDQIVINPAISGEAFSLPGDSGSVICVDRGNGYVSIIGLLHSGTADGSVTIASAIDDVCAELDVVPWTGEIILGEGHPDVVSTGFGAVYTEYDTTFLSVTNDYVCDGTLCAGVAMGVNPGSHVLKSVDRLLKNEDIIVKYIYLLVAATCITDVAVRAELEATSGGVADTTVSIRVTSEASMNTSLPLNTDVDVGIRTSLASDCVVAPGITASLDRGIFVSVDADASMGLQGLASTDATILTFVALDASAYITGNIVANADTGIDLHVDCTSGQSIHSGATADADCFLSVLADACVVVVTGVKTEGEASVLLQVDCETDIAFGIAATTDADIQLSISADVATFNNQKVFCLLDSIINIQAQSISAATITDISYISGGPQDVGECTGVDATDLFYGSAL